MKNVIKIYVYMPLIQNSKLKHEFYTFKVSLDKKTNST
jgi:hypothetical protein